MNNKILFVDDESHVLDAFRRQFRKQFEVSTAPGGKEGLEMIRSEGPFAVIVTDMRMPEMDGVQFLKEVRTVAPESVRLMLTGNADQQTAMNAVNEGNVFRFLTKPCPYEILNSTLETAVEQHRLMTAERELMEGTLNGTIKLLTSVLSMVAPSVFGRAVALRETAKEVARALKIMDTWDIEIATMLSHIAYVTLPPETLEKARANQTLSEAEQQIIAQLPETGSKLLANIPRLEKIAAIILYQNKHFDGSGFPKDSVVGEAIPLESRIIKVLYDLKALEDKGVVGEKALEMMQKSSGRYDPHVLQTVAWFLSAGEDELSMSPPINVTVSELQPDQLLISNVETMEGILLFTAGHKLSEALVAKLISYHRIHRIKEPIRVSVPIEQSSSHA